MYKQTKHESAFRFRRFCRAGWAAYSSMHREVTIGHVASYIADRQLGKTAAALVLGMAMCHGVAQAQDDEGREARTLPDVTVSISADTLMGSPEPAAVLTANDFQQSNIRTIADLVALLPGVDVRVRGVGDAQGDISMRGGSFDQMIVLLGGINITDAQTGHHNLDIPIDLSMVERVELLSPSQLMARGIVAFCGAVNIVVGDEYRDRLLLEASGGSYGTANLSLLAGKTLGQWTATMAAAYHRSDGYMPNTDYRHGSLYLQASRHSATDDWQLQAGGQMKGFGSQAFYSIAYPDQYEATRTLVASAFNVHRFGNGTRLESALYGRLHSDRFELFREGVVDAPSWYSGHNHHLASTAGLRSRLVRRLGVGEVLVGAELRREGIWSNVLGLPDSTLREPYTNSASRLGASLFGGYHYADRHWNAEAVALGYYNTSFGFNYGLSANAEYRLGRLSLLASASHTYRLPSFTDLYYKGANQVPNPDLNSESSTAAEVGARYATARLDAKVVAYYRAGRQIIDWVRSETEEMWYSMNHTTVNALGFDATASLRLRPLALTAEYSFCHINKFSGLHVSMYALEYLRHKAGLSLVVPVGKHLSFKGGAQYRMREGFYADDSGEGWPYGDVLLLDASVEYAWPHVVLFVEGFNLTGADYRDHGGVPMPGRTAMAGLRVRY